MANANCSISSLVRIIAAHVIENNKELLVIDLASAAVAPFVRISHVVT
jgi:hypothetical protein